MSGLEIVRRLLAGGDWDAFVREHRAIVAASVHSAARRYGRGAADVDDAVSEVFVELLKDDRRVLRAYRGESALSTWLTVVAWRVATREFARRARQEEADAKSAPPAAAPIAHDMPPELASLPERERRALILFHVEGASYREIGERLGIPAAHVGMVLLRAREALAKMLGGHPPPSDR